MSTPPPLPGKEGKSFFHQAAKASVVCPGLAILLAVMLRSVGSQLTTLITGILVVLLITAGFVLGVVALFGIPKHGVNGIVASALIGLVLNGMFMGVFVNNFNRARALAKEKVERVRAMEGQGRR